MGHLFGTLFDWPQGIVVGNLIASAMWAAPALAHLHWRLGRHHKRLLAAQHCPGCQCSDRPAEHDVEELQPDHHNG